MSPPTPDQPAGSSQVPQSRLFKFKHYTKVIYDETCRVLRSAVIRKTLFFGAATVLTAIWLALATTMLWHTSTELFGSHDPEKLRNLALSSAALWGIPLILWRTWVAERQTRTAELNRKIAEAGLNTERLAKATEQLGANRDDGELYT